MSLRAYIRILNGILTIHFPTRFLYRQFSNGRSIRTSLYTRPKQANFMIVNKSNTSNKYRTKFRCTSPCLIHHSVQRTRSSLMTSINNVNSLFPSSISPNVRNISFRPFPINNGHFLRGRAIRNSESKDKSSSSHPILVNHRVNIYVLIRRLFQTFYLARRINPMNFPSSLTNFLRRNCVYQERFTIPIKQSIRRRNKITSCNTFVSIRRVINTSCFLIHIIPMRPTFTSKDINFNLLMVRMFNFVRLFATSRIFIHRVNRIQRHIQVYLMKSRIPFNQPYTTNFVTTPPSVFPSRSGNIKNGYLSRFFPNKVIMNLSTFPLKVYPIRPCFISQTMFN